MIFQLFYPILKLTHFTLIMNITLKRWKCVGGKEECGSL